MTIKYFTAPDIKSKVDSIASDLELRHIINQQIYCIRSKGSKAKRTIARIHGLGKIWQGVLRTPPSYIIEVIADIFDKMTVEEQEKTLIHELLHIPGGFSGGFRPHKGYVERRTVEKLYKKLQKKRGAKKNLIFY